MKKGKSSIKNNMIRSLVPMIIVTIVVSVGIIYFISRNSLITNSRNYLNKISMLTAIRIETTVNQMKNDTKLVGNSSFSTLFSVVIKKLSPFIKSLKYFSFFIFPDFPLAEIIVPSAHTKAKSKYPNFLFSFFR